MEKAFCAECGEEIRLDYQFGRWVHVGLGQYRHIARPGTIPEINADTDQRSLARACHRIVRAMHDGHCPECGLLDTSERFVQLGRHHTPR